MPCHPRYMTLEASTKLVISAISCRFRGLLPTIFASRADFDARDPRYTTLEASTKLVISAISCRFRGLLPTIFGSRADFDAL